MKKLLSILTVLCCMAIYGKAQTVLLSENFETSKTTIPAGWKQQLTTQDKGFVFGNSYGTNMAGYVATHTYTAYVDDWDNNVSTTSPVATWDTLYTPSFSCAAYTHVFISLDVMFWMDDGAETGTIIVSTDGGVTWNTAVSFPDGGGGWANGSLYDLSALAGGQPNVMLGFTYYNGYASTTNGYVAVGMAVDNISVYAPAAYDLGVASQNLPFLMQVGKPYTFTGTINNYGGDSIVSMNVNYSVNHGPAQVDNVTGITGFNGLTTFNFSHNIPFTPSATGNYSVRFWADNLNSGNVDSKHSNDTLVASFMAVDTVQPKSVLYEEGTGQSCVYCMLAGPNLDSVAPVVKPYCNIISYHVPIPSAPDYMYQVTSPTTDTRANYYGVYSNGTPDGFMDGWNNLYPGALAAPNDFSTPVIAQEAAAGSPFKINIVTCTYATNYQTYNITAEITAYGPFAAGLTAQVALVADSITYTQDYSADDPTASFAPPIGSSSGGSYPGAPDYLYEYTMKFPHVAEQMLPTGNGTTLSSFTAGQTQTLNLSWKSTHPLSYKPNTYPYDSSSTMHMVVFVQTNTGLAAAGVPAKFVYQSASALVSNIVGIDEVKNEVGFNMYPNPSRGNTTIVYSLNKTQQVTIEVYDMFGQKVYVANNGQVAAGEHTININSQQFQSGVYTVVFRTDGGVSTQKLIIQQ